MNTSVLIMDKVVFILLILSLAIHSCTPSMEDTTDYDAIKTELMQDSALAGKEKRIEAAVEFYKAEIQNQFSHRIKLTTDSGDRIFLDAIETQQIESFREQLDSSARISIRKIADSQVLDESWLADNILNAILSAGRYPWNQQLPDSIFLNYLLPYKVIHEYPQNWWDFLGSWYRDSLTTWSSPLFTGFDASNARWVHQYTTIYPRSLPMWWNYEPQASTITKFPSLNEILLLRNGSCFLEATINVMILRTCGIPATIYEVPFWGSRNGSHAGDVYWSSEAQKMVSRYSWVEYDLEYYVRPAKVVHYTFRYTGEYQERIEPWLHGEIFQIPQMSGNHWYDATAVHNAVSNIQFHVPDEISDRLKLGYIYVMNYGEWVPVDYGYVRGDSLFFKSMGRDIIYRTGFYSSGKHSYMTRPFLLDRQGKIRYSIPDTARQSTIQITRINHAVESQVDSGNIYTLQYLDRNGIWQDHETKNCLKDGELIFSDVPTGAFYFLSSRADHRHLARIFLIGEQGQQMWY